MTASIGTSKEAATRRAKVGRIAKAGVPSEKPAKAVHTEFCIVSIGCHVTPLSSRAASSTSCELFFLSESDGHPSLTTATLHTRQNVSIIEPPSGEPVDIPHLKKPRRPAPSTHTCRLLLSALLRAAKFITHHDPA